MAAIQLGIFASDKDVIKTPNFVSSIIKHKIIDKLLVFIRSEERDKYEAGVLALSFLTESSNEIVEIVVKKNIIPAIIRFMRDKKEGLKATAALCCRNLYLARPLVQKVFIREGGADLLII